MMRRSRRRSVGLVIGALVLAFGCTGPEPEWEEPIGPAAPPGNRPNLVLIMADDLGYEGVGANGGTSYATPHLDRLATTGMRFEHCYSQPLCTPSRVQLMTGLYNQRNYIRFGLLHPQANTFAHALKRVGYATCVVGKWQLDGGLRGPRRFGFDEYCLWQVTRRPGRYPNPGLEVNGKEVDYRKGEYGPDVVSDYLCDFMERNRDGPFLAYYPMILPHWPFEPTPDSPDWDPSTPGVLEGHGNQKYFPDMVAYADKIVGKIVAKLDELGIRDQTLVLFTTDNGASEEIRSRIGQRTVWGGKGTPTDAGTRVPLIASWPGKIAAGSECRDLVDFSDFYPTVADLAGAPLPSAPSLDGRSFGPQLLGERGNPRPWTYCWFSRDGGPEVIEFARTKRFKLYRTGEFYDVAVDPREFERLTNETLNRDGRDAKALLTRALESTRGTGRHADPAR